ncbi:MAG: FHA domain-containing protein, partial [Solirubrobacteraceae bacterium]
MPRLVVKAGPSAGSRFELNGEAVVGRGEVDCVIDDAELSRRHLVVRVTPAGVEVEDLGSLNGTWYQGKRVEGPMLIPAGGIIRLGESELAVEIEAPAPEVGRTVIAPVPPELLVEPPTAVAPAPAPPPAPAAAPPPPPTPEPEPIAAAPPTNIPEKRRPAVDPPAAAAPPPPAGPAAPAEAEAGA